MPRPAPGGAGRAVIRPAELACGGRQVEVRDDRLGPEDDSRPEETDLDAAHLGDDDRHVVRLAHRGALDRSVGLLADDVVGVVLDLVGAEALDAEQRLVGDAVDADDAARHLEVLGRLGQVVAGLVGSAFAGGECHSEDCGSGDGSDCPEFHVKSPQRRWRCAPCLSETGQIDLITELFDLFRKEQHS